jgi:hypothetical protein
MFAATSPNSRDIFSEEWVKIKPNFPICYDLQIRSRKFWKSQALSPLNFKNFHTHNQKENL